MRICVHLLPQSWSSISSMQDHCGCDCNCLLRVLGTFGTIVFSMPRFATTGTVCYRNGCRHRQPAYVLVDTCRHYLYGTTWMLIKNFGRYPCLAMQNIQHRSCWYGIHLVLYFPYRDCIGIRCKRTATKIAAHSFALINKHQCH